MGGTAGRLTATSNCAAWIRLALTRPRGTRVGRVAVFCGSGAAVLPAGHGLLFVIGDALAVLLSTVSGPG